MPQIARKLVGKIFPKKTERSLWRTPSSKIEARVAKEKGIVVIFLESVCNDPAVIAANVALKVSSGDPDYKDYSREEAERDFLRRIKQYESVYETITEPHLSYLRITNVGSEVTLSRIHGYLQSRIAFYLMNLHLKPRSIYLSRVRYLPPSCFRAHWRCSTVKANSMWKAKLAEIQCCPRGECCICELYPPW